MVVLVATQADVARLAGTSSAVVSYVLNSGPRPVSEATRARVLEAMRVLDYRPNKAARALRSRKSNVLGLVVPDGSHPFFAELARELERAAYDRDYVLFTGNSFSTVEREQEYFSLFREHQVDGVVLTVDPRADVQPLLDAEIPVVLLDQPGPDSVVPSACVDYAGAAAAATQLLVKGGRRRIGFIGGNPGLPSAEARAEGWLQALQAHGMSTSLSTRTSFTRLGGYTAGLEMFSRSVRPDGIFVSSDQQAVGLLRAADECGVRVPEDVWVIAFDDSDDCLYTHPMLSTVRQPVGEIVQTALNLLFSPDRTVRHEQLGWELVLRASTGHAVPTVSLETAGEGALAETSHDSTSSS